MRNNIQGSFMVTILILLEYEYLVELKSVVK